MTKSQKVFGLSPAFVEVSVEKMEGGGGPAFCLLPPTLNRNNLLEKKTDLR